MLRLSGCALRRKKKKPASSARLYEGDAPTIHFTDEARKPPAGRSILLRRGHDDHRAAGALDDAVRDAADEQFVERAMAVRADDDQIGLLLAGFVQDLFHDRSLDVQRGDVAAAGRALRLSVHRDADARP